MAVPLEGYVITYKGEGKRMRETITFLGNVLNQQIPLWAVVILIALSAIAWNVTRHFLEWLDDRRFEREASEALERRSQNSPENKVKRAMYDPKLHRTERDGKR